MTTTTPRPPEPVKASGELLQRWRGLSDLTRACLGLLPAMVFLLFLEPRCIRPLRRANMSERAKIARAHSERAAERDVLDSTRRLEEQLSEIAATNRQTLAGHRALDPDDHLRIVDAVDNLITASGLRLEHRKTAAVADQEADETHRILDRERHAYIVSGAFPNALLFISRVGEIPGFFKLQNIKIQPAANTGGNRASKLELAFDLVAYHQP